MTNSDKSLFLSDEPIQQDSDDEFSHIEYVETLQQIVTDVEPPWNIGIFGEWGAGKTSIIRMLYRKLEQDSDVLCIEFDAWKHAEESIRTELLLELDQQIGEEIGEPEGVLGEQKITNQLYDVEEKETPTDQGLWEQLKSALSSQRLLIGVIIITGLVVAGITYSNPQFGNTLFTILMIPLLIIMVQEISRATDTLQRKFLYPRKEWSGAYQRIFDGILDETDSGRVLITIDNLDRCESDVVLDVLISLKTFLETEKCVYLIPCDDKALQSHIRNLDEREGYFDDIDNGREFLRKFFQTHIRIPPFLSEDIEEYAKSLSEGLETDYDEQVLHVLTSAHVKNPRRIKQSLNRFTTMKLIAERMEDSGKLSSGKITENLPFLAKIAVLEEEHPQFFQRLYDDPRLLDDANRHIRSGLSDSTRQETLDKLMYSSSKGTEKTESNLATFLRSTRTITVDNPEPFLRLGEPSYVLGSGNTEMFLQYLRTGQHEDVRKLIKNSDDSFPSYFQSALAQRLDSYQSEGREQPLFSTIDTLLSIYSNLDDQSQQKLAGIIADSLIPDRYRPFLKEFKADELMPIILEAPSRDSRKLMKSYANMVTEDHYREDILKQFIEYADEIPWNIADSLCEALDRRGGTEFELTIETIGTSKNGQQLATGQFLERAISYIDWDEKHNEFENIDYYKWFDTAATQNSRSYFVNYLLDEEESADQNDGKIEKSLINQLLDIEGKINSDTAERLFERIREMVRSHRGEPVNHVHVCFHYYTSFSSETADQFEQWVSELLSQWNTNRVQKIIEWCIEYDINIFHRKQAVTGVLDRVPDFADSQTFLIKTIIPEVPEDFNDELFKVVESLCESDDRQERELAVNLFSAHSERLQPIQDTIIACCEEQISSLNNSTQRRPYLEAAATVYDKLEPIHRETFVKNLSGMLSGNHTDYQVFKEIWVDVKGKVEPERRVTISRDLTNELDNQLAENPRPNQLSPLVDVFCSLVTTDDVDDDDGARIIERLGKKLTDDKLNAGKKAKYVTQLTKFKQFYGEEDRLLDRIQTLLNNYPDNSRIKTSVETLFESLEETGTLDQGRIEQVRS